MTVAETMQPLVAAALGNGVAIQVRCWDGSQVGPSDAALRITIRNRRALRRLLWAPNELGFARAYVSGDIEVEGDLFAGLDELARAAVPEQWPGRGRRPRHQARTGEGRPQARHHRAAAEAAGRGGPAGRPPAQQAPRCRRDRPPLRRRQRLLPDRPRRVDDVFVRVLGPAARPRFRSTTRSSPNATWSRASSACSRACGCSTSAAAGARSRCTPRAPTARTSSA